MPSGPPSSRSSSSSVGKSLSTSRRSGWGAGGGPSIGSSWFFLHASPSFGGGTCFLIASRPRASARSPLGVDRGPSYDSFLNGGGNALDVSLESALIRSSRSPLMCGLLVG